MPSRNSFNAVASLYGQRNKATNKKEILNKKKKKNSLPLPESVKQKLEIYYFSV